MIMAPANIPTPENKTILQFFEWNCPPDQKHFKRLLTALPGLKENGFDQVWIPPQCKASNSRGNGYDVYDLYDLGEFEQKGSRSTKWGTKEDLMEVCKRAEELSVGILFDAVLSHKAGADHVENCQAVEVDRDDRTKEISKIKEISAWLGFGFNGRGDKYSSQKYHHCHFNGTDYNAADHSKGIFKIVGENRDKDWSSSVDTDEKGNFDYLMFANLDYTHQEVCDDVKRWGVWIVKELGLSGFRFDAARHISRDFLQDFVSHVKKETNKNLFSIGEYWSSNLKSQVRYLDKMHPDFHLFDPILLFNFSHLSLRKRADLRKVFYGSLVSVKPSNAVTIVQNHDTQPGQTMATKIASFFRPLAHALILLRQAGYPCIFYGDIYGIQKSHNTPAVEISCRGRLPDLVLARKLYAYGEQRDYFDKPNCIGWTRLGTWDRPAGVAVVMSNAGIGRKRMYVGQEHHKETWTDILGWEEKRVLIDHEGYGLFCCPPMSMAVFVEQNAQGRDRFGKL